MNRQVLAAQLYTIRDHTGDAAAFAESMAKIRQIGYPAVQISGIGPIPDDQVKAILQENNLTVCITHIPFDRLQNDLDGVVAQHHLWDCRHVAVGSMPVRYRQGGEDGYTAFAKDASVIGKNLHANGLTFSYHNHSFEFCRFGKRTGLEIIYEESDPRYLQAELDTYWVQHGGGDPAAWIRRLKGRMPVIHLKDMVIVDDQQAMAEVGEGNLNWQAILDACGEAGVEWYAVEQDTCRRDPFESLRISFENLIQM